MEPGVDDVRARTPWWTRGRYLVLLMLLCALPLVWPKLPPLIDAPGHMARYYIQSAIGRSPYLRQWYSFRWMPIGNLGVDLLVVPLSHAVGVRLATKLIVMAIPPLTAAGLLLIAREAHGRVPPTALFALPLTLGIPFQLGFINYCLAIAFALLAFGFWLRLTRLGRYRLRIWLFVPIGLAVWLCHTSGWGVLGLLIGAGALARATAAQGWSPRAFRVTLVALLPLLPPVLPMLLWRSGSVAGATDYWFYWSLKLYWVLGALRERWELFDCASAVLLVFVIVAGSRTRWIGMARTGAFAAIALGLALVCMPHLLLGSAAADVRLTPVVLAVAIVGLRPPIDRPGWAAAIALTALAFLIVRIAAATVDLAQTDAVYDRQLAALDHVPRGARIFALVGVRCPTDWASNRLEHLASQATIRRDAFVNDQWALPGAQLLSVHYPQAGAFAIDPSQVTHPASCQGPGERPYSDAIAHFPRPAFDYLWLIAIRPERWPRGPDLRRIWRSGDAALFRIDHRATGVVRQM